jgi:hypothetical protein
MAVKSADPIAPAEATLRLEREALNELLTALGKIDAQTMMFQSTERDQTARPSDFAANQRRLAAVRVQLSALRDEETALNVKITGQRAVVQFAEANLRRAQSVIGAERVRELLPEQFLLAKRLDEATRVLIDGYHEFRDNLRAIRALSGTAETNAFGEPLSPSPAPSDRVVAVAMKNALSASLTQTDLEFERLPPHARHSFSQLASAWNSGIERWVTDLLPQARKAA